MKICMLSDYVDLADEGLRNIAFHLQSELSSNHEVLPITVRSLQFWSIWNKIKMFNPHIVHFIPGPTIISFFIMKTLKVFLRQAKSVMSATIPTLTSFSKLFIPVLKPDMILTQSYNSECMFNSLGCDTHFLPSGVDTGKFIPVSSEMKQNLRKQYQFDEDVPLILHVGSLTKRRNTLILSDLKRRNDIQVLVVGNLSIPAELDIWSSLIKSGCNVMREYIGNIEEIYGMADCYVFPTTDPRGSVEMPLSVIEAMACNLPIITTKFGSLPRLFEDGDGLLYAEKREDFNCLLKLVLKRDIEVKTREKVLPYSWKNVASQLERIYTNLMNG